MREYGGSNRRHVSPEIVPERSIGLQPDHLAAVDGRPLFPTRVLGVDSVPRLLISGVHNSKIGKAVTKGEWMGMPIFTLTLSERATCPRSCAQWLTCFGNAMPWPVRHDHTDPLFMDTLRAEIITTARANPKGLVVRLHVLGDFFSVEYVKMWTEMFDRFPQLKSFAYTARNMHDDTQDEESRRIGMALAWLSDEAYDQFALRFSHTTPGQNRTIVVKHPTNDPEIITCPGQLHKTETCSSCALCWSPAARSKTIAFLLHGKKSSQGVTHASRAAAPKPRPKQAGFAPLMGGLPGEDSGMRAARVRDYMVAHPEKTIMEVAEELGVPHNVPSVVSRHLAEKRARGRRPIPKGLELFTPSAPIADTPEKRIAALSDEAKAEIAARYGAKIP